jgi:tRNA pseudouridine-54 N-methylase
MQQGSEDVKLVVRTINSAAFTSHDWEEYVVTVSLLSLPGYVNLVRVLITTQRRTKHHGIGREHGELPSG